MICGDLDSIRPEVLQHYEQNGIEICEDEDLFSTDLQKCLKFVAESQQFSSLKDEASQDAPHVQHQQIDVAIFGGLGGRADQAFSQLHHLSTPAHLKPYQFNGNTYLVTAESLLFLLQKGLNRIHAPVQQHQFTENVGIIPIGRPAVVTTRGLEWDVTNWLTEFGTQISTSNHIKAAVIEIDCSERVLLTLEFDRSS